MHASELGQWTDFIRGSFGALIFLKVIQKLQILLTSYFIAV